MKINCCICGKPLKRNNAAIAANKTKRFYCQHHFDLNRLATIHKGVRD